MSEILGVLFAVMVGMYMLSGMLAPQQAASDTARAITAAQQQKKIYAAAAQYIEQNAGIIQGLATATSPVVITVPMLQAAGMNLAGASATNPYGQTWQVQVLQPTPNNLQALVMSTGGEALPDKVAVQVAKSFPGPGGFIPRNDSGIYPAAASTAYGAYAGWQIPTAAYADVSGGHPAALLTVVSGEVSNNYLYRNAVPGQPQLNQMNANLDMAGNNVANVGNLSGKQAQLSRDGVGECCNPNGQTLALSENTQSTGRKPTIQFHAGGAAEGYIELAGAGEPRRLNLRDNQGAGLGLSASGTISAPRLELPNGANLSAGGLTVANDGITTTLRQSGSLYLQHNDGSDADLSSVQHINSSGTVSARTVALRDLVTEGATCGTDRAIGLNANGALFACWGGTWRNVSTALGEGQTWGNYAGMRSANVNYLNNTGRAIMVNVSVTSSSGGQIVSTMKINGVKVADYNYYNQRYNNSGNFAMVVPANASYQLTLSGDNAIIANWAELR